MASGSSDILSGLPTLSRNLRGGTYEAHLSTEPPQAGEDTRLPQPHEHGRGSSYPRLSASPRAQAAGRLILLSRGRRTRLTDSPEFERIYRQGAAYRGRLLSVHAFPNGLGSSRLGLSVSRKVGNAVLRNAVRRRLREAFYAALPRISGDLDLVVSARPPAAEATFDELREELARALRRLDRSDGPAEAGR